MQPHHVLAAIILQMILALAHQSSAQTVIRRIHAARLPAVRQMQQSAVLRSVHLATRKLSVTRRLTVQRKAAAKVATALP